MSKKLWGGRFAKKTDPLVEEFTRSIQYDYKLAECDLLGSIAHVAILRKAKFISAKEAAALTKALVALKASVTAGTFKPNLSNEDIHTQIQNELERRLGDVALKLHTARSRNDQVAFSTKLYCKFALARLHGTLGSLAFELAARGREHADIIMPGYTHMQHAQPVLLRDYLSAYATMMTRDAARVTAIAGRLRMTMGSGALAGTPIDAAHYTLKASHYLKGYDAGPSFDIRAPFNALDTVSDRDFVVEILAALSLAATHLSRLSEDLILWSTQEFGFVELDDAYCTGSSLMPQKKNADSLELIRGHAGRVYGSLVSVLTMLKGLPLSYNRDMQLDKEPLFSSLETVSAAVSIMRGVIATVRFDREAIAERLKDESLYATDLVYYLVGLGVPFKKAHASVGALVRHSLDTGIQVKAMSEEALKERLCPAVTKREFLKRFDPVFSVRSKRSIKRSV